MRCCAEISNPPHVRFHKKTRRRSGLRGTLIFCPTFSLFVSSSLHTFKFLTFFPFSSPRQSASQSSHGNRLSVTVFALPCSSFIHTWWGRVYERGGKVGIHFFHHVWGLKETSPSPLRIDVVQQLFPLLPNQSKPTVWAYGHLFYLDSMNPNLANHHDGLRPFDQRGCWVNWLYQVLENSETPHLYMYDIRGIPKKTKKKQKRRALGLTPLCYIDLKRFQFPMPT